MAAAVRTSVNRSESHAVGLDEDDVGLGGDRMAHSTSSDSSTDQPDEPRRPCLSGRIIHASGTPPI